MSMPDCKRTHLHENDISGRACVCLDVITLWTLQICMLVHFLCYLLQAYKLYEVEKVHIRLCLYLRLTYILPYYHTS